MRALATSLLAVALALSAAASAASEDPKIAAGRRLAERDCGECHATGLTDVSRTPDAPAFRDLYKHCDVQDLPLAFDHGMFIGHPRMPMVALDPDELEALTRYLVSFKPAGCRGRDCAV
jgi:mono/diheme cytochrome c family protein